jgi:aminopeptidase N
MPDSQHDSAPRPAANPTAIRLADYRVPDFLIDLVDLVFRLGEDQTTVSARLFLRRNPASMNRRAPLRLDGDGLTLRAIALDGKPLDTTQYLLADAGIELGEVPDDFVLEIETVLEPEKNLELSGLYKSGGAFCTQCEAEGFRRITYFLDRPDVLSRFTTTIVADPVRYPVLLSNGNPVDRGATADGLHWVKWEDPHPKPAYLSPARWWRYATAS